jgi:Integrase core domain
MREQGMQGAFVRKRHRRSTRRGPAATPAPDLVDRNFEADAPDRLWVADSSRIPTGEGPLWLASVRDAFSRRVAENFFSSLKVERVYRTSHRTREDAELDLVRWIDGWCNPRRIQRRLSRLSPDEYEEAYHRRQGEARERSDPQTASSTPALDIRGTVPNAEKGALEMLDLPRRPSAVGGSCGHAGTARPTDPGARAQGDPHRPAHQRPVDTPLRLRDAVKAWATRKSVDGTAPSGGQLPLLRPRGR